MLNRWTDDPLTALIYLLLRDQVLPGDIELLFQQIREGMLSEGPPVHGYRLSNGYLADYAKDIVERIDELRPLKKG